MSTKKKNGSRKDPLKTPKVWEKARREKMKIYFDELQKVLPFYDPSTPMSRFEILQKSKTYIKDLQDQNQDLLNGGFDEVYKFKMTKLKQRVKELLKRVDQLTDLLRTANIMIPPLEAYPEGVTKWMNQRPKKWTEKINLVVPDEKIKSVLMLIEDYKKNYGKSVLKKKQFRKSIEKLENTIVTSESCLQKTVTKRKKLFKKSSKVTNVKTKTTNTNYEKSDSFTGSQSPSQYKENQPVDFNLLSNADSISSKNNISSDQSTSLTLDTSRSVSENLGTQVSSISKITVPQKTMETQQNVILSPTQNVLQSNTFILTNDGNLVQLPILNSPGTVFSANSNLLTPTAIVKPNTGLLTPLVITNKPSPFIVLQKSPPQIIQTASIFNTTPQVISVSKPNIQILGGSVVYTSSSPVTTAKPLSHIISKAPANKKRITRDTTVTTYVNKIPIPALSKHSYAKKSVPVNSLVNTKEKGTNVKAKDISDKPLESESETQNVTQNNIQNEVQNTQAQKKVISSEIIEKDKETGCENKINSEVSQKRILVEEKIESHKKQKLDETSVVNSEENVFKPIENEAEGIFCNLALPNAINPSLSVSPTAAFLSSFPIVTATRSEAEDDISERKIEENKDPKQSNDAQPPNLQKKCEENTSIKETKSTDTSKQCLTVESNDKILENQTSLAKVKMSESSKTQEKLIVSNSNNSINNQNNLNQRPLDTCKSWDQFHQENCEIRSEVFYLPPDNNIQINNSVASVGTVNAPTVSFSGTSNSIPVYNTYPQNSNIKANHIGVQSTMNDQVSLKNNQFEYPHTEKYMNKISTYNSEKPVLKKQCSNNAGDSYNSPKTQSTNYQVDSGPNYQLISAKEVPNQRNARTVNWMTEPDIRNRGVVYNAQSDKMIVGKSPAYAQTDNFYVNNQNTKVPNECAGHFIANDQNKTNYQKNDFYVKDQRCKTMDKRIDAKCYNKNPQNSYNIFDYNYTANCYGEEDSSKYCNVQPYSGKTKKNISSQPKKKSEDVHQVSNINQSNDLSKRIPDQIITNLDFNPVGNQECFSWVPGKNVEWLPSKSFGLDTNLVVPSTLPTLVGDLALGTTSTNDMNQAKNINTKICQSNLKSNSNDISKEYVELGLTNNPSLPKPLEHVDPNKQYLEPFANLSKNIFDVTPTNMNNAQMPKNDFDKINFVGNNNNETIVLKNIFELPVSKSSGTDFSRSKQRTISSSQNTFLSVSQLVEPPTFETNSMKNENQIEQTTSKDPYAQNYPSYPAQSQKTYKNKTRSSHCKYSDRKYHGYKNSSSSYTAEALIRTNTNVNYQPTEFTADVNSSFFGVNGKNNQKPEQFPANNKIDFEISMKTDFNAGTNQNIYSDFNFSSPVPNFTIGPTVGTDFGNHDAGSNFSAQNNSFFGDFITPEYPLSENVSNSLLLPPCSIALQNPFVIDKRNIPAEKNKNNSKQYSTSRNRKHYECSKTSFNEFTIPSTSAIFTTSSLPCPTIFTTSSCQNLLPVPTQSIPISFSTTSFSTNNITFPPPLSTSASGNYHRFPNSAQNSSSGTFLPTNTMFTTCTTKPLSSSHNCYSSNPLTSATNSVISSPFPVGNVPFSGSSQSSIPFLSLSNPIIPSSIPTSSSNSLANFNLSTIFPEINQKGNYHYS